MIQRAEWLAWIDPTNLTQHEWARNYLSKKGLLHDQDSPFYAALTDYELVMGAARHWPINDQIKDRVKNMRGAWSQEQHRKARTAGRKGYNYVLSKNAHNTLERLAKQRDGKITETLEVLIDDVNAQLNLEKAKFQKSQEKMLKKQTELKQECDQTRKGAMEIWRQLDLCLLEMSKLALSISTPNLQDLSEDQRRRLEKHYDERRKLALDAMSTARLLGLVGRVGHFDS